MTEAPSEAGPPETGAPSEAGPPGTGAPSEAGPPGTGASSEAQVIADRARGCPGVAGLSAGPFGTVATYLPGERLPGVSVNERAVTVAIVATLARPLPETAEQVRLAVAELAGDRLVNVRVDDIIVEGS